jgi:PAS domain S-box-containing protein
MRWIRYVPWFILAVGLALVAANTVQMKIRMDRDDQLAFNIYGNEIKVKISERLHDHARILRSGVAFLSVDEAVTRDKWHRYVELQNTKNRLPGIQGIGFSLLIPPAERTRHIQQIRNEGFPEYTIHPEGDRELYSAIIYLEPFDERNQRAFGYDMFSEPVRRAAMERSRDEDLAVLSGKVLLVQETDEDVQAGTLMYVPVYRKGMPTSSVEQRRTALYGWVYSAYRMTDLMHGILGDQISDQDQPHFRQIQVFDGELMVPKNLLFQSDSKALGLGTRDLKEQFNERMPIDFNGHRWTLRCIQTSGGLLSAPYRKMWAACLGETLVTFIIFGLLWTLLRTSEKQYRVAQKLTLTLRDERERMARVIQGTDVGTWEWNVQTGEVVVNDKWAQLIGYTLEELAPITMKTWETFTHPDDFKRASDQLEKHFSGAISIYDCECRMKHKDGHWVWIQDRGRILTRTDDGQPLMMFGTHMEITDRKQTEEQASKLLEETNQAKQALLGIIEDNERSQVALQESEAALVEAQSIAGMGSYAWDIPSGHWTCSVALDAVLGIDQNYERTQENWLELIHPDDRAMMHGYLQEEVIGKRQPYLKECRIIRPKDHAVRWVFGIGRLVCDAADLPVKLVGTIQDITERKQAEDVLRASEERYRRAQAVSHVGSWEYDLKTTQFSASDETRRIFGFDPDSPDFSTDEVESCILERERIHQALMDLIETNKPYNLEFEIHPRDGAEPRMLASMAELKRDERGAPQKVVGVIQDITARKFAEDALRESEGRYHALLTHLDAGIIVHAPDTSVVMCNVRAPELLGLSDDQVKGKKAIDPAWSFVDEENAPMPLEKYPVNEILRRKKPIQNKILGIRKSAGEDFVWVVVNGFPMFDRTGNLFEIVISIIDITERKQAEEKVLHLLAEANKSRRTLLSVVEDQHRAEEQIHKLNEELEQRVLDRTEQLKAANKELEAFSYSVSHDLRAPLRAVDGYTRMLSEDYGPVLDKEGQRICSVISSSAQQMGQLIDDLLAFSRFGRAAIVPSRIDMTGMARAIFFELTTPEKRERVEFILPPLPEVAGDPTLLRQVWVNLLSNALKFSANRDHPVIEVSAVPQGDEILYCVRDNGAGFDMRYANKLFGVFQRLHTIKEFAGTGVGLAIVQRILVRHGGRVWAEGEVDHGAAFYFALKGATKHGL